MFWIFKSSTRVLSHSEKEKKRRKRERERPRKPFWAILADLLFLGLLFLCCSHFLARAIWRQSATDFFFYMSFPLLRLPRSAFPLDTFAVFHFVFLPCVALIIFDCVSLFCFIFTSTVYVFLGEPHNLYDFMTTMQMMRLFTKGEYMVISVDWETYSPDRAREYLWSWVVSLFLSRPLLFIHSHIIAAHSAIFHAALFLSL